MKLLNILLGFAAAVFFVEAIIRHNEFDLIVWGVIGIQVSLNFYFGDKNA